MVEEIAFYGIPTIGFEENRLPIRVRVLVRVRGQFFSGAIVLEPFFISLETEGYLVSKVKAKRFVSRAPGNNLDEALWNNSKGF